MSKPLIAEKEVILKYNVKIIWNIVVNNSDYKWRSDIKNNVHYIHLTWKTIKN